MEITLKCNMRCIHCGSAAGSAREKELSVDECLHVADDLIDLGCSRATFIGGEVFLYDGWEKVARSYLMAGPCQHSDKRLLEGDKQIKE
jgi:MoaA/NifB/PqqE/SkfB family radical SAM enzyme